MLLLSSLWKAFGVWRELEPAVDVLQCVCVQGTGRGGSGFIKVDLEGGAR